MFIQTMTADELWREYSLDLPEIVAYNEHIDTSSYVTKLTKQYMKAGRFVFTRQCKTKRGNTYINVFTYIRDKSVAKACSCWEWYVMSVGLMNTPKGICAIMFSKDRKKALTFQAHFFVRYKLRMMECGDWKIRNALSQRNTTADIISYYIMRNQDVALMNTGAAYDKKQHYFASVNDGIALFQYNGKTMQANTFVTRDMLSQKQKSMLDDMTHIGNMQKELQELLALLSNEQDFNKNQILNINNNYGKTGFDRKAR